MSADQTMIEYLDEHYDHFAAKARAIWENPEIGLQEKFASKLIAEELEKNGFEIEWGVGQMETAFVGSWGEGKPVIGILGEYDALPGLSQDATPDRSELVDGGPGHGCGHNLYGVGALGSALAMQAAMKETRTQGTVRYYGCPAEETLTGKTYMAKAGVFDDLDASVTWHPGYANTVWANGSSLAMNSFNQHSTEHGAHSVIVDKRGGRVMTKLYARQTRRIPQKLVCHLTDCGEHLGSVHTIGGHRVLVGFRRGWVLGNDGVYALSKYAAEGIRRGRPPAHRRGQVMNNPAGDGYTEYGQGGLFIGNEDLPARVRCSSCGCVQWIDTEHLDLASLRST